MGVHAGEPAAGLGPRGRAHCGRRAALSSQCRPAAQPAAARAACWRTRRRPPCGGIDAPLHAAARYRIRTHVRAGAHAAARVSCGRAAGRGGRPKPGRGEADREAGWRMEGRNAHSWHQLTDVERRGNGGRWGHWC